MDISQITAALKTLVDALENASASSAVDIELVDNAAQEARDRQSDLESVASDVRNISNEAVCDVESSCDSAADTIDNAASELCDLANTLDELLSSLQG